MDLLKEGIQEVGWLALGFIYHQTQACIVESRMCCRQFEDVGLGDKERRDFDWATTRSSPATWLIGRKEKTGLEKAIRIGQ